MAKNYSNQDLLNEAKEVLEAKIDRKNEVAVTKHMSKLRIISDEIISALKRSGSEDNKDELKIILPQLIDLNIQLLCCNVKGRKEPILKSDGFILLPLLGDEVEDEIRDKIVKACIKFDTNGPKGRTRTMFKRWGLMMGLIRQVKIRKKIGTRDFLKLKDIASLEYSAEYIVYHKALEHKEKVTDHLSRGCLERMKEILEENNMI